MIGLQLVALICVMFLVLGIFNMLMARRRQRQEDALGIHYPWYKRLTVLTTIEYFLLALAFLLNLSLQFRWLPPGLSFLVIPTYIILLLASGLLAGFIILQSMNNARKRRTLSMMNGQANAVVQHTSSMTPAELAAVKKRKRERRHKAAIARRRRAGKA